MPCLEDRRLVPSLAPTLVGLVSAEACGDGDHSCTHRPSRQLGLVAIADGGEQPLGMRLLEVPRDRESHERSDPHAQYVAYVPPGGLAPARGGGRRVGYFCQWARPGQVTGPGQAAVDQPPVSGAAESVIFSSSN